MKTDYVKKGLAIGIIVLFIAVAIASGINAKVSKQSADSKLVIVTAEIYGPKRAKLFTEKLTKQDATEIDILFETIKAKLDNAETKEEKLGIFNETIMELYKYDLFPDDISVAEIQDLVTGGFCDMSSAKTTTQLDNSVSLEADENKNCQIMGKVNSYTYFFTRFGFYILLPRPLMRTSTICYGYWEGPLPSPSIQWVPASGWVYTEGINGTKTWKGAFYGQLPFNDWFDGLYWYTVPGVYGFTGIKIDYQYGPLYYLGFARWVKLGPEVPPDPPSP